MPAALVISCGVSSRKHEVFHSPPATRHSPLSALLIVAAVSSGLLPPATAPAATRDPDVQRVVDRGLEWIANTQSRIGHWGANDGRYPTAMTALAGMAL